LNGIIELMINLRKEARQNKNYVLSDRIRNELSTLGIQLKDEKDGNISYTIG
jgi:cysteinyl-tRNA synthetase